jgi:hypothetical protein
MDIVILYRPSYESTAVSHIAAFYHLQGMNRRESLTMEDRG